MYSFLIRFITIIISASFIIANRLFLKALEPQPFLLAIKFPLYVLRYTGYWFQRLLVYLLTYWLGFKCFNNLLPFILIKKALQMHLFRPGFISSGLRSKLSYFWFEWTVFHLLHKWLVTEVIQAQLFMLLVLR